MRHSCHSCSTSRKPCNCDHDVTPRRESYSFKEGLTMMAAKAVGIDPYLAAEAGENAKAALNALRNAAKTKNAKDRAEYIREVQHELRGINPAKHGRVVNAIQAKLLALQGRGGDREIAHLTPGEVVIPRSLQTPELMRVIRAEAARQGINPARYTVGHKANHVNPKTGAREFGCNPGDPGECFGWGNGGWGPNNSITTIGYVKPEMPPNYSGGFPGVTYGVSNLPPNFGDGSGSGVDTAGLFNNKFTNLCARDNADAAGLSCCETFGPRVEPDFARQPDQAVLDGMNALEIESWAKSYDVLSNYARFASTVMDMYGVIKALRALGGRKDILDAIEDRYQDNPESIDLPEYLGRIASTYRAELEKRGGSKCTLKG